MSLDAESAEYALKRAWWHALLGLMEAHMELIAPDPASRDEIAQVLEKHMDLSLAASNAYHRRIGVTVEEDAGVDADWDVPISDRGAAVELIRSTGAIPPDELSDEE